MAMRLVKGACPKCHQCLEIEVDGDANGKLRVTCDFCAIDKPLASFINELEKQEKAKREKAIKASQQAEQQARQAVSAEEQQREHERIECARNQLEKELMLTKPGTAGFVTLVLVFIVCTLFSLPHLLSATQWKAPIHEEITGLLWLLVAIGALGFALVCKYLRQCICCVQEVRETLENKIDSKKTLDTVIEDS